MSDMRVKMNVVTVVSSIGREDASLAVVQTPDPADPDNENTGFALQFPSGQLNFSILDPALIGILHPGDAYYLDLTKVV